MGKDASETFFYDLVWPQADMVLRYARVLCGSAAEAEDLAQETLLKAFRSLGQFRPGSDLRAWLMTILRHTHIDRVRKRVAEKGTASLDEIGADLADREPVAATDPADFADEQKMLGQFSDQGIIGAMQKLSADLRWTLLLVDVEGLDLKEAAAVLGVPVGTVKSRCHRAREMLRQTLRAEWEQSNDRSSHGSVRKQ